MHSAFFGSTSRESVLGSSIWRSHILAEGFPLAGNGKFPLDETTCSLFFSRRMKRLVVIFSRFCLTFV